MDTKNQQPTIAESEQLPDSPSRRAFFSRKTVSAISAGAAVVAPTMAKAAKPGTEIDDTLHVINRLTMGVTPELYEHVNAIGVDAFIEEQLNPASIDDSETTATIESNYPRLFEEISTLDRNDHGSIRGELAAATVVRAVTSKRQLQEVMTDFWTNHFNVYALKSAGSTVYKVAHDRGIREMALGKFSDLLMFNAKSPAMLEYLDNHKSRADYMSAHDRYRIPNENYARELLELHTVGVNSEYAQTVSGYTEEDVEAVAHILSGWGIGTDRRFLFREEYNSLSQVADGDGVVRVMNSQFHAKDEGSIKTGEQLIRQLPYKLPAAYFICWKLCRYFIRDTFEMDHPMLKGLAWQYRRDRTEIVPTLRRIFRSREFRESKGLKVKRANELMYSVLRATGSTFDFSNTRNLNTHLNRQLSRMDHTLFMCEPPTGYPTVATAFLNAKTMAARWNMCIASARNGLSKYIRVGYTSLINDPADIATLIEQLSTSLLSRQLEEPEKQALYNYLGRLPGEVVRTTDRKQLTILAGLILTSASFQIR